MDTAEEAKLSRDMGYGRPRCLSVRSSCINGVDCSISPVIVSFCSPLLSTYFATCNATLSPITAAYVLGVQTR